MGEPNRPARPDSCPGRILRAHLTALAVGVALGSVLGWLSGDSRIGLTVVCLGLALSEAVLLLGFDRSPSAHHREPSHLSRILLNGLDRECLALQEQAVQLARLAAAIDGGAVRERVWSELARGTAPRMAEGVADLTLAETSLPEHVHQTRTWLAQIRRLAAQTPANLSGLNDEGRGR